MTARWRHNYRPWWRATEDKVAMEAAGTANAILNDYGRTRRRRMNVMRAIYLNEEHPAYGDLGYRWRKLSRYPVTQGGVDSLHAKMTLSQPRPKIMPCSRRFKAKRRAKGLQRWVDGEFRRLKTPQMLDDMVHDTLCYGAGVIKVASRHGRVCHERRHPGDILTDPWEERAHDVRSMYEVVAADREVLADSDLVDGSRTRERILSVSAPVDNDETMPERRARASLTFDQVQVIECWRLPNGPDMPGRHVMCVGDILLLDEDWEWETFPFSIFSWGRDPERMWGQGLVERGAGIQSMINHHSETVEQSFKDFVPKLAIPRQAKVDDESLDRTVGQIVKYDANPHGAPHILSPGPISPMFLEYTDRLANRWYATTGVSQMEARSETDSNLDSAKAILVQADVTSGRFHPQGKQLERAVVRLAELTLRTADLIGGDQEVDAGDRSWRDRMKYGEARMEPNEYAIEVWPVSSLSQSVAGRMEEVNQLVEGGYIKDPDQARELLDIPEVDEFQDVASARRLAAEREVDRALDGLEGEPSKFMDLPYLVQRATAEYNLAGIDGAEEDAPEVMDRLRDLIAAADFFIKQDMPPPAPAAAPGLAPVPPMPPDQPMPPVDPGAAVA